MAYVIFPCKCKFKLANDNSDGVFPLSSFGKMPRIDISTNPWNPDSIYRISINCPVVWDMISRGDTKGIFQLEGYLGKTWAKQSKPENIEELGALVALLRPGCMNAKSGNPPKSMTQRYVDRKHKIEEIAVLHESVEKVLRATFGVLVYQEQAMRIAEEVAGFNKQEADVLRKAIGKKKAEIMAKVEKEFMDKAKSANIISEADAKEIFGWIRESQKYSFNKSHAIAYGYDGYWSAYMKAHFPLSFYGAWLFGAKWKADKKYEEIEELLNDAKLHNILVKTPQLNNITENTTIVDDNFIQFGMSEIKGIGSSTVDKIKIELKNTTTALNKDIKDWTWIEYLLFAAPRLSKTVNEALISVGALDYMGGGSRNNKLFEYAQVQNLKEDTELAFLHSKWPIYKWSNLVDALTTVMPVRKMKDKVWVGGGGTATKTREQKVSAMIQILKNPPTSLADTIEWIAMTEEKYLGTPVSITKVDGCMESIDSNTTCKEFLSGKDNRNMIFALEIINVDERRTKGGKTPGAKMANIKVRDSSCSIEAKVFPKQWKEFGSIIYEGNTILALGQKMKDGTLSIYQAKEIS